MMCYTCGDRIVVKDGRGQFVDGNGRRHRGKGKHFSHTSNSRCHGEGPAHYQLKAELCASILHQTGKGDAVEQDCQERSVKSATAPCATSSSPAQMYTRSGRRSRAAFMISRGL